MPALPSPRPGPDTPQALLDAAEVLFAERGIAGTSLRAVTRAAGANLAAVHYHFGSREGLVRAVLERRLAPLNRERLRRLELALAASGGRPGVAAIVTAFVAPALEMVQRQRGGHDFARALGHALAEPGDAVRQLLLEQFTEVIERFVAALGRALPGLSKETLYWRLHFTVGAMIHTAGLGFLAHRMSGGRCNPADADGVIGELVAFVSAGLDAPPPTAAGGDR